MQMISIPKSWNIASYPRSPPTHLIKALRLIIAPKTIASSIAALGMATDCAPFQLPLLVLPSFHVDPEWPFEVANTDWSTWTCAPFVNAVVGNVWVVEGLVSENAVDERKTSAKPGAGTCTWHVLAVWSQFIVWTFCSPVRRPSDAKVPPKVYCWIKCETTGE